MLEARNDRAILVVDDDASIARVAAGMLKRAGFTVLEAHGPGEALEAALARPEPIDLLLTDVRMPGMTGPELARGVCASHREARVLYMSGDGPQALARGLSFDVEAPLLRKPFTSRDLVRRVEDLLAASPSAGSLRS